jgi:hypothetical protein
LLTETLKKKAAITDRPRRGTSCSDKRGTRGARASQADSTPVARTTPVTRATPASSSTPDAPRSSRSIPAAIRREVWERDDGRCTFVDERGRRCSAKRAVEYHHIRPYGRGGGHEPDNIALHCSAHNQFQADLDFGRNFMDGRRHSNRPRGLFEFG